MHEVGVGNRHVKEKPPVTKAIVCTKRGSVYGYAFSCKQHSHPPHATGQGGMRVGKRTALYTQKNHIIGELKSRYHKVLLKSQSIMRSHKVS